MKVGLTVELRCPQGSVAFQSHIDAAQESIRVCNRDLAPGETWIWKLPETNRDEIAFFAAQSKLPATILINGTETLLEGQLTTDFGIAYARRSLETFGTLPFSGNLTTIQVTNESDKRNHIAIMFGEVEPSSGASE
jgi:hypothetical protein